MVRRRRTGTASGAVWAVGVLLGWLVIKHPLASLAISLSLAAGFFAGRWFELDTQTQGIVAVCAFALMSAIYALLCITYGAIYVINGLHPLTGIRMCVYVGLTTQRPYTDRKGVRRYPRIDQHLFGDPYRNEPPKPWADTVTDWHFTHESYRFLKVVLCRLEVWHIHHRHPLYNDQHNRRNQYRIDKHTAFAQRAQRDQGLYTQGYIDGVARHRPSLSAIQIQERAS